MYTYVYVYIYIYRERGPAVRWLFSRGEICMYVFILSCSQPKVANVLFPVSVYL